MNDQKTADQTTQTAKELKLQPATDTGSTSRFFAHLVPSDETVYQLTNSDQVKALRDKILKEQNNKCLLCGREIQEGKAVLDHSHRGANGGTGLIRGVLCSGCNQFLGKIENNLLRNGLTPELLRVVLPNLSNYVLEQKHKPYVHPDHNPKPQRLKITSYNKLVKLCKENNYPKSKIPEYPKRQYLTESLNRVFKDLGLEPEFYKE